MPFHKAVHDAFQLLGDEFRDMDGNSFKGLLRKESFDSFGSGDQRTTLEVFARTALRAKDVVEHVATGKTYTLVGVADSDEVTTTWSLK